MNFKLILKQQSFSLACRGNTTVSLSKEISPLFYLSKRTKTHVLLLGSHYISVFSKLKKNVVTERLACTLYRYYQLNKGRPAIEDSKLCRFSLAVTAQSSANIHLHADSFNLLPFCLKSPGKTSSAKNSCNYPSFQYRLN